MEAESPMCFDSASVPSVMSLRVVRFLVQKLYCEGLTPHNLCLSFSIRRPLPRHSAGMSSCPSLLSMYAIYATFFRSRRPRLSGTFNHMPQNMGPGKISHGACRRSGCRTSGSLQYPASRYGSRWSMKGLRFSRKPRPQIASAIRRRC